MGRFRTKEHSVIRGVRRDSRNKCDDESIRPPRKKQKVDHPVLSPDGTNELEMLESGFCTSQNSEKKTAYSYLTPNRNCESPTSLDFFSFLSTVAKGESNQQLDPSSFVSVFRSKLGSHKKRCFDDELNFDTATMGEQASKCFCVIE